ncbi:MAG: DUF1054 family protein [Armatimonadota bacterium]
MAFSGWSSRDIGVFEVPDFHERMALIRSDITPRITLLARDLEPFLGRSPFPFYAHVARHLRRRINPPDETWVAFSRDKRAYKRYAHLVTGIGIDGAFVRLVVKADGVDIANLKQMPSQHQQIDKAKAIMHTEAAESGYKIDWYDGLVWAPLVTSDIESAWAAAEQDFVLGRFFSVAETSDGPAFIRKVADTFDALMTFYQLSAGLMK